VLLVVLAEFTHDKTIFEGLFIFLGEIVRAFANRTFHFNQIILRHSVKIF
jgi:hypothetical protein